MRCDGRWYTTLQGDNGIHEARKLVTISPRENMRQDENKVEARCGQMSM